MTDAIRFTTQIQEKFIDQSLFLFWRGRVLIYNGQLDMGKKHMRQALNVDPDNKMIAKFWKSMTTMEKIKDQANEEFKLQNFDAAIELYNSCLDFDPLNNQYNQTVLYNRACAYNRKGQNDLAMEDLDLAIKQNPEYAKAYFKKGDIKLEMKLYDEAIGEYSKVKQFAPQTPGLREKLRNAQLELKKSKRKDLYALLGTDSGAGESMIKKAYRKMAIQWHPDKHANGTEEEKAEAEKKFKEIGEAYAVLSDPQKRQRYDAGEDVEEIEQGKGGMGGGMDPNDIFRMFMGGGGGGGGGFNFQF